MKKLIASVLALSLIFLCTACGNVTLKTEKWVLIEEKYVYVEEDGLEETLYEKSYGYDSLGRKNYETKNEYGAISSYSNFQYDNNGNVISCTADVTIGGNITNSYSDSYTYDSNNNLVEYSSISSNSTSKTKYQYNEKGDKTYEEYSYNSGSYESKEIMIYTPYYENGVCVQSEMARTISDMEETNYWLDKYSYDENGNKTSVSAYIEAEKESVGAIEHNGRQYKLSYIIYYTYEKITVEEMNSENSFNTSTNNPNDNIGYDEPTTEIVVPVSKWGFNNVEDWDCGIIEITGYNLNGDEPYVYYENEGFLVSPDVWYLKDNYLYSYVMDGKSVVKDELMGNYSIIDNDTISLSGFDESGYFMIKKRRISETFEDFVVFEITNNGTPEQWFIPFSIIDWERGVCEYTNEKYQDNGWTKYKYYYKLYLK